MGKTYLTKQGLTKLKEEYDDLTTVRRMEAAKRIKQAIELGGYEDNLQYDTELEKQLQLEKRISELEELLRDSDIIDLKKIKDTYDFVSVGALVIVEVEGEKDQFRIVGSYEANPTKGLISNESPVGQALLGSKIGDVVEVTTPVVKLVYKILEIKYE